jgi:hypothetical protein
MDCSSESSRLSTFISAHHFPSICNRLSLELALWLRFRLSSTQSRSAYPKMECSTVGCAWLTLVGLEALGSIAT